MDHPSANPCLTSRRSHIPFRSRFRKPFRPRAATQPYAVLLSRHLTRPCPYTCRYSHPSCLPTHEAPEALDHRNNPTLRAECVVPRHMRCVFHLTQCAIADLIRQARIPIRVKVINRLSRESINLLATSEYYPTASHKNGPSNHSACHLREVS